MRAAAGQRAAGFVVGVLPKMVELAAGWSTVQLQRRMSDDRHRCWLHLDAHGARGSGCQCPAPVRSKIRAAQWLTCCPAPLAAGHMMALQNGAWRRGACCDLPAPGCQLTMQYAKGRLPSVTTAFKWATYAAACHQARSPAASKEVELKRQFNSHLLNASSHASTVALSRCK